MDGVDPPLLRLVAEIVRPGAVVWDIGANVGLFTFSAAVAAGPSGYVLAVEPDIVLARLLRRSAIANHGHAPVDVLPTAVADDLGVARFHIARRNRATSHLDGFGATQTGGIREAELVPTVTLDWLAGRFPRADVVKIDVEAAEVRVLSGGPNLLATYPTIICEVTGENSPIVRDILAAHGYTLYDGEQPAAERIPTPVAPFNTLAINPSRRRRD